MTDSAWFALTVAVVGGAGGFAGSWLSTWMSLRSQARSRRQEQQQRDGAVVGAVLDYLGIADPRRLAGQTADPDLRSQELRDLEWRQGELRLQLQVLASGHPDVAVSDTARGLATSIHNSFSSTAVAVHDVGTPNHWTLLETAVSDHAATRKLAEELLDKTRRYAHHR
ncbi:hypothetical protein ACFU7D_05770 [Nocardioides sp. NPDC057577]|uniref:hypothetical protein n=1 Tax=Nocardioides sp. NPDC057577 TaxID=3346171 RepID=UPI00366CEBD2